MIILEEDKIIVVIIYYLFVIVVSCSNCIVVFGYAILWNTTYCMEELEVQFLALSKEFQ